MKPREEVVPIGRRVVRPAGSHRGKIWLGDPSLQQRGVYFVRYGEACHATTNQSTEASHPDALT